MGARDEAPGAAQEIRTAGMGEVRQAPSDPDDLDVNEARAMPEGGEREWNVSETST